MTSFIELLALWKNWKSRLGSQVGSVVFQRHRECQKVVVKPWQRKDVMMGNWGNGEMRRSLLVSQAYEETGESLLGSPVGSDISQREGGYP